MQQGSQQAQGEVLELEIEELLRNAFQPFTAASAAIWMPVPVFTKRFLLQRASI